MKQKLTKTDLRHLAKLARISIENNREEKLLRDIQKIIDYFEELKSLDVKTIGPTITGELVNEARLDISDEELSCRGKHCFPEEIDNYLKVPEVFGDKGDKNDD